MLSVKQVSIKYHFLSLWYDSTWDWTPVSRTIGEHFSLRQNPLRRLYKCIRNWGGASFFFFVELTRFTNKTTWDCIVLRDEGRTTTLRYKNITLFILLGVKASVVCERQIERGQQRQTVILTDKFIYSWSYHTVLFSKPHLALLLLSRRVLNRRPLWVTASWVWLTLLPTGTDPHVASAYIIS